MLSSVQIINSNCLHNAEDACSYTEMGAVETSSRRTACNALMLGSLTKSAFDNGIWPLPQKPYSGLTLRRVMDAARCLRAISMCNTLSGRLLTDSHGAHEYMKSIQRSVEKREAEAGGLNLEDFLPKD